MGLESDKVLLRCRNLTRSFEGVRAVDNVTLEFPAGQVIAVVGPNGAGKTTLFHLLSGFLRPDQGEIWLKGERVDGKKPWEIARRGVGRLFQDVRVFEELTVLDNVIAALPHVPGQSPLRSLLFLRPSRKKELEEQAKRWIEYMELEAYARSWARDLSFGEQKLVALARLLAMEADVLLLDEPVAGIFPELAEKIMALVVDLAVKHRKAVVFVEHNMKVVRRFAHYVHFMHEGKVELSGKPEEILSDPYIQEVYLGRNGKE